MAVLIGVNCLGEGNRVGEGSSVGAEERGQRIPGLSSPSSCPCFVWRCSCLVGRRVIDWEPEFSRK